MTAYSDANNNLLLTAGYTGDGLRAWKAGADGTKTYFIYNGEDLLAETDANGNVLRYNTWAGGDLISRTEVANGASIFYQFDSEGNVVQRLDSTDTVLTTAVFDAWGNQVAGDAAIDPYGYKGEFGYYTDAETGLILCTHRYYDPQAGRWINRDPIGYDGGMNLYGYCGGDAVNGVDPNGNIAIAVAAPIAFPPLTVPTLIVVGAAAGVYGGNKLGNWIGDTYIGNVSSASPLLPCLPVKNPEHIGGGNGKDSHASDWGFGGRGGKSPKWNGNKNQQESLARIIGTFGTIILNYLKQGRTDCLNIAYEYYGSAQQFVAKVYADGSIRFVSIENGIIQNGWVLKNWESVKKFFTDKTGSGTPIRNGVNIEYLKQLYDAALKAAKG